MPIQPQGLNWGTERLRNWDGVTLGSDRTRVEIVNISGTQSIGDMPNPFVGDAFTNGGLSNLTGMDVSDNQITRPDGFFFYVDFHAFRK